MFEIKNRLTGAVLFSLETTSLKLCIEAAIKSRADLGGADLRGAYLGSAKIRDGITVVQSPICIQGLEWFVTIWDNHMQIGCEFHSHDEWRGFTEQQWASMGGKEAIRLKREHMGCLSQLCAVHAAKAAKKEPEDGSDE